jgi:hypothetical protein
VPGSVRHSTPVSRLWERLAVDLYPRLCRARALVRLLREQHAATGRFGPDTGWLLAVLAEELEAAGHHAERGA